jgi:PAS domain S-box-containing protein
MQIHGFAFLSDYLKYLRDHASEVQALYHDFLITVTNFFRDPEAFAYLEREIIPKLFVGKNARDQVRVWVVGCATGEEAYSLAILLLEHTSGLDAPPALQLFASDLSEEGLRQGREGFYPETIATDVSPERLGRFFVKEPGGYRIRQTLREVVLFAPHSLLKDPPFSRLDLVACRNLLIYVQREVQGEVMQLFHYALRPDGYLFLGSAETVEGSELFSEVSRKQSLYQRQPVATQQMRLPSLQLSIGTPRLLAGSALPAPRLIDTSYGLVHARGVDRYAPPSVLVNADQNIVYFAEGSDRYLQQPPGEPTNQLLRRVRDELRLDLTTALYRARERGEASQSPPLPILVGGVMRQVSLVVQPMANPDLPGATLVFFLESAANEVLTVAPPLSVDQTSLVADLEAELATVKNRLQVTVEEYETSQEEMRAVNEELQSMNEELRSAAEELETSKEELQSVNEELMTVNQENKNKIEELNQLTGDLQNLLASTDIATLFLDRDLRIKRFTPRITDLFNLLAADRGRPLAHITHKLGYTGLLEDARQVLETLVVKEREVRSNGHWYIMRLLPYRTPDHRIDGVVITFVEISERKQAEEAVRRSEERLQQAIEIETVGVVFLNNAIEITDCNEAFLQMSGFTRAEIKAGRFSWALFTPAEFAETSQRAIEELRTTGSTTPYEKEYIRKDGSRFWALFAAKRINEGEIVEFVTDITAQKRAQAALRESEARRQLALEAAQMGTFVWYPQEDRGEPDAHMLALFGLRPDDTLNLAEALTKMIHPGDRARYAAAVAGATDPQGSGRLEAEIRVVYPDESLHWVAVTAQVLFAGEPPQPTRMYGTAADITERKRHEANLVFLAEVSQDLARLTNIDETMAALGEKIGAHFNASLVAFSTISEGAETMTTAHAWHRAGVPSTLGEHRISDYHTEEFARAMRAGETYVVRDAANDPRLNAENIAALQAGAFLSVPLVRDGEWQFNLSVANTNPRDWRDDEIELLRELTTRIWTRLERARAEDALRQSEERFRAIFEQAAVGIVQVAPQGGILFANPGFCQMLGYNEDELQQRTIPALTHPDAPPGERALIGRMMRGELAGYTLEKRYLRKDGQVIWGHLTCSLVRSPAGVPEYAIGVVEDITERQQAEAERERLLTALTEEQAKLQALNATLEQRVEERTTTLIVKNRELDRFAHVAAHDLKEPLRGIQNLAEWIRDDAAEQLPLRSQTHLTKLLGRVRRITQLVDSLLAYARIGRNAYTVEMVEPARLIYDMAEFLLPDGCTITVAEPMPRLTTMRVPLETVFFNLIHNAIKHHHQPEECQIQVSAQEDTKFITFAVSDNGPGIPADQQTRIFELFHTLRPRDEVEGSGMGLPIVQRILESYDGSITVEANPGGGSIFRFTWPRTM